MNTEMVEYGKYIHTIKDDKILNNTSIVFSWNIWNSTNSFNLLFFLSFWIWLVAQGQSHGYIILLQNDEVISAVSCIVKQMLTVDDQVQYHV